MSNQGRQAVQTRAFLAAFAVMACAVRSDRAPVSTTTTAAPKATAAAVESPTPAVSDSPRERALALELKRDVDKLAQEIGERNVGHVWELAEAADYLATELESAGYSIERQGFLVEQGTAPVQNLSVSVRGGRLGNEIVVVAAHYDTVSGSRGRNDNASGVAALLALARAFRGAHPARTLRLVLLVNEQPPFAGTADMGSVRYARYLEAEGESITAAIALRALGAPSSGSQSRSGSAPASTRVVTDPGVTLAAPGWAESVVVRVTQLLSRSVNVSVATLSGARGDASDSRGAWGFWHVRLPAVLVTSGDARAPGGAEPSEDEVDFRAAARRVRAIEIALEELLQVS